MSKRRNNDEFYTTGGRRRGDYKTADDQFREDKAKGHLGKPQPLQPEEELKSEERSRGLQKGFGKNQGKEAMDLSTAHGTRAPGAFHN